MPSLCPHCRAAFPSMAPAICPFCAVATGVQPGPEVRWSGAWLMVRAADGSSTEFRLPETGRVGRNPDCALKLSDRELSKEHAEITREGADWWVRDLGSSNGTLVNGKRIGRVRLRDGDQIAMGTSLLVFHAPFAPAPARAGSKVTMVPSSTSTSIVLSVRAEDLRGSLAGFRPEREIVEVGDLRRDYEKLRIANEFHRQVGLEPDGAKLHQKILQVAFDLLDAETGVILLYSEQRGLEPVVVSGHGGEVRLSQTLLEQVVRTHEGVLTQDASLDERFSGAASIVAQRIRSAMAVPMLSNGALRGVLYLDSRAHAGAFTEKDLRILTGVAGQAAAAIENAELARRIEQEAETRAYLSRFLSPALVEQAQRGQLELKKGGELCEVTVLFADIRGFTDLAECSQPQEVVTLLNEFFELMVDEVFAHGGVLDKFIGDCIMALWGAPVARPDDAARALRAAVAMQQRLQRFNEERKARGQPPIRMGIGVNTGQAVVGNMGSSKRLEYTAIGDSVNLASRLCDLAREGEIVASAATLEKGDVGFEFRALPPTKVKGKQQAVQIFQVLGLAEVTQH